MIPPHEGQIQELVSPLHGMSSPTTSPLDAIVAGLLAESNEMGEVEYNLNEEDEGENGEETAVHLPWPFITLLRFSTILKAKEELSKYDWILFLDADMAIVDTIVPSDLFGTKPFIGVHHPCHYLKMDPHGEYPGAFETDERSTAAVDEEHDLSVYFQGCLWGGRMPEVIDMMEELDRRTQDDLKRDMIAKWHDESQMNKFFSERRLDVKVLHPAFAFPEDFASQCQFEPKIVHVSKDNSKYHQ